MDKTPIQHAEELLAIAKQKNSVSDTLVQFENCAKILKSSDILRAFLLETSHAPEQKAKMVQRVFEGSTYVEVIDLIVALVNQDALSQFPAVYNAYKEMAEAIPTVKSESLPILLNTHELAAKILMQ